MRLYDDRTGEVSDLTPPVHVHVADGAERAVITADLLRRVARRHVRVTRSPAVVVAASAFNVPDFDVADAPPDAVQISASPGQRLHVTEGSTGDADPMSVRLAVLRLHHRATPDLDIARATRDLSWWRDAMAEWANAPGRPLDRTYAAEAEAALANDLDSPAALDVLDRLVADPDVPPGAKLETVIHLDMLLALDLVAHIGRV